ncbi:MAG: relaxase domain-containing protein, partial [Deferribacteraceae bacterium]|nr:relaxase domain-containing protein [Deferribacteraceae bacterium]
MLVSEITSLVRADDYYFELDTIEGKNSQAFGKLAAYVGIEGEVSKADFDRVLSGEIRDFKKTGDKIGWDFNLSAPKTVSENLYIGGDERIREVHIRAVDKALEFTEENFIYYR